MNLPDVQTVMEVWVGIEHPAAARTEPSAQSSNLKQNEQRQRKTSRQKRLDSQASLASLVVVDVAVLRT